MVSPLKGLTRAQITARAAARRAELAKKKKKKPRKKKTPSTKVKVSQKTINQVAAMGKAKALKAAAALGATAEFKEAVKRYYGASGAKTLGKKKAKPKVISGVGRARAV